MTSKSSSSASVDSCSVKPAELRRERSLGREPAYLLQLPDGRRIGRVTRLGADRWRAELRRCLHDLGEFESEREADEAILRAYRGATACPGCEATAAACAHLFRRYGADGAWTCVYCTAAVEPHPGQAALAVKHAE